MEEEQNGGKTGEKLLVHLPEVIGHFGIEEWIEAGVGVGQHVGSDLQTANK